MTTLITTARPVDEALRKKLLAEINAMKFVIIALAMVDRCAVSGTAVGGAASSCSDQPINNSFLGSTHQTAT